MGKIDRKARERWKSAAIVFLLLSAGYLLAQERTAGFSFGLIQSWVQSMGAGEGTEPSPAATGGFLQELAPAGLAVKNENGRFGVQYDGQKTVQTFNEIGNLLGEAVGSAEQARQVPEIEWRQALEQTGAYFYFLDRAPLSVLSDWFGSANGNLKGTASRLLLSAGSGSTATLYYQNTENGLFYACGTAVPADSLKADLAGYLPNGASFAYELGEDYKGLPAYTMVLQQTPSLPVLAVSKPLQGTEQKDALLKACEFNPYTNSRYPAANGTEVVIEKLRTLRIYRDGTVTYHSGDSGDGGEAKLRVPAGQNAPFLTAAVDYTRTLAEETVGALAGEASIYLMDVTESGGAYRIRFGYQVNGMAVRLAENDCAAEFVVEEHTVSEFTLRFRQYTASGENTAVLPERQAAAAMEAVNAGDELEMAYIDSGGDSAEAGWIAGRAQ